jgi:hypothetical protein
MALGHLTAQFYNDFWEVDVQHAYGATVLKNGKTWGAFTLGNYIMGDKSMEADPNNRFFQHEYGHVCQSGAFGIFYMSKIAIPSLFIRYLGIQDSKIEIDANRRAFRYFNSRINGFYTSPEEYDRYAIHTHGWDYGSNHLFQVNNGSPYLDYNDVKTQKILQDKLKLLSVDYFFFLYF